MSFKDVNKFLFGTLRGRLILSVALVHAVMMTIFIMDITIRQKAVLLDRQKQDASALSKSLSTAAAAWLAANDVSGLQEMVENQSRYPELVFAILSDERGQILAHTDKSKNGQFLLDLPSDIRQTVISQHADLVDIATPSFLGNRHVGWARVGLSQKAASRKLADTTRDGFLYAIAAILIGSFIAWLMGKKITMRLYAVQSTINTVKTGDLAARSNLSGDDEAALIAREFNAMLDRLEKTEKGLVFAQERLSTVLNSVDAIVYVSDMQTYEVLFINQRVKDIFGDITGSKCWQALQKDQTGPCDFCSNKYLLASDGTPAGVYHWEFQNTVNGRWYDIRDRALRWVDDRLVKMQIAIDVTSRKETEAAMLKSKDIVEKIFSMTTTCIAYMDRDFNFINANKEYAASDGKSPEYFIGKNHFDLYPDEDNEKIFRRVVETGQQYMAYAKPFKYKEHPERGVSYWDLSLIPVKNAYSEVEAVILSLVNVTDRILAQNELRELNERLEETVAKRTSELKTKNAELERMNKLFVGREIRMSELKKRISELEAELGRLRNNP